MKAVTRKERQSLPFAEKLRILDKLRERSQAFAEARKTLKPAKPPAATKD